MRIYPVIHYLNTDLALEQARIAQNAGAHGVFLINHHRDDQVLGLVATRIKAAHPGLEVGINFLASPPMYAALMATRLGLDMVWADSMGVSSSGLTGEGAELSKFAADHPEIELFASVAFKYRAREVNPPLAAQMAKQAGFTPTTSGDATGHAPDLDKIAAMSSACGGELAIASGMTPENIDQYRPLLAAALVATGVSIDEYRFDPDKLKRFVVSADAEADFGQKRQ